MNSNTLTQKLQNQNYNLKKIYRPNVKNSEDNLIELQILKAPETKPYVKIDLINHGVITVRKQVTPQVMNIINNYVNEYVINEFKLSDKHTITLQNEVNQLKHQLKQAQANNIDNSIDKPNDTPVELDILIPEHDLYELPTIDIDENSTSDVELTNDQKWAIHHVRNQILNQYNRKESTD